MFYRNGYWNHKILIKKKISMHVLFIITNEQYYFFFYKINYIQKTKVSYTMSVDLQ